MDTYCKIFNKKVDEKFQEKFEHESEDEVIKIYCFKCRKHTSSENLKEINIDGKIQLKADYIECNGRKSRFVSK